MEASPYINGSEYEPIEEFYSGKSVLVTGGTGFLGKALIEKLVYSCPNLSTVYVLIRDKKNVMGRERFQKILESKIFTRIKNEKPEHIKKIIPVMGDITLHDLGVTEEDKVELFNKVYTFLKQQEDVNEQVMDVLKDRPNTYTFTKALTEPLVAEMRGDMPTVIVRPSVVVAAMHEPIRGWLDKWLGPTLALDMIARGWLRCLYGKSHYAIDIIPVDYVTNATIVAAARRQGSNKLTVYNCCTSTANTISLRELYALYTQASVKAGYNATPLKAMIFSKSPLILNVMTFIFQKIPAYFLDLFLILGRKPTSHVGGLRAAKDLSTLGLTTNPSTYPHWRSVVKYAPGLLNNEERPVPSIGTTDFSIKYVKLMRKSIFYLKMIKFFSSRNWFMMSTRLRDLTEELDQIDRKKFQCNPAEIRWDEFIPAYFNGVLRFLVGVPERVIAA